MDNSNNKRIANTFDISDSAVNAVLHAEESLTSVFSGIDEVESVCMARVLKAFAEEGVGLGHFAPSTGYGYDDAGRDTLERLFARALQTEEAIVRPQLTSGTHAIYTALCGLTSPGDTILCATGMPYDTLEGAIGITGELPGSLKSLGVKFQAVPLTCEGHIDVEAVAVEAQRLSPRVVYIQRSRGYSWRCAFLPETDMAGLISAVRAASPRSVITVDNCYGEFTRPDEPAAFGADVIIGSLIKNPGGGLAPTGGYIAGGGEHIERIANRLTVPGMGREVGSYAGSYRPFYQGLFMAPHTVAQALKSAALFARLFESLGFDTLPGASDVRSDIVQSIRFDTAEALISFCRSIQAMSPVDSLAVPEPWDMPGYTSKVIMAAGAFVQGASIELSADAPIREPYTAYLQGALTYSHGRLAAMKVLDGLMKEGTVKA